MKTKPMNLLKLTLLITVVMCCFSCQKQQLTKKDLMNAYTIGWHQGYQEGIRHMKDPKSSREWSKGVFIQDSCLFDNSIWAVK